MDSGEPRRSLVHAWSCARLRGLLLLNAHHSAHGRQRSSKCLWVPSSSWLLNQAANGLCRLCPAHAASRAAAAPSCFCCSTFKFWAACSLSTVAGQLRSAQGIWINALAVHSVMSMFGSVHVGNRADARLALRPLLHHPHRPHRRRYLRRRRQSRSMAGQKWWHPGAPTRRHTMAQVVHSQMPLLLAIMMWGAMRCMTTYVTIPASQSASYHSQYTP